MKKIFNKSSNLYKKIYSQSPGGVLAIRRPYNFVPENYPIFFKRGKGSKVYDIDNNKFIDMTCGYGPIILGYQNKLLDNKVINQIKNNGNCFTLTQPVQYKLVSLLNNIFKTDKAIIVKTGSDAASLSIRLARSFTGKQKVIRCGYHGWHDWCVGDKYGIPKNIQKDVIELKYNDLSHLKYLIKENSGKIACLIIWPVHTPLGERVQFPSKEYLNEIKDICNKNEIILIFDEIRSGFRMSLSGAQSFYKIRPDLTIVGKAMANGYPISAVLGKREIMDQALHKVYVSSTFFGNSIDQVAALETIKIINKNNILKKNMIKGKLIKNTIEKLLKKFKFKAHFSGDFWFPFITFEEENFEINRKIKNLFYSSLIDKGIFLAPHHHGYIMDSHSNKDIKDFLNSIEYAFNKVNKGY
jgi:glutamate-1-semialdehyde aminotransferase